MSQVINLVPCSIVFSKSAKYAKEAVQPYAHAIIALSLPVVCSVEESS